MDGAVGACEKTRFINVLQERMSVIGPRPHAVARNEQYRRLVQGYMIRHKVKPGISGWASKLAPTVAGGR